MELHYINTGFPYTVTESFMDFFEGLTYAHADFALTDGFQDQVVWQDNIDPDNMTYEYISCLILSSTITWFCWQELLDLGEAVGTQSRGLSQERISLLPVTKFKCGFFSRKKRRRERCVICQMEYRRGNLQMTLPCKHVYHASCVTRWLSINKVCPVCFAEVPGEEPKRQ
nr:unnamed protein product [Digitaria exilis]